MSSAVVTDLNIFRLLEPYGGDRCACDILGLFRWFASKERPGYWIKARYSDIAKYLGYLYSKQAIARATKLLDSLGILLQHRHSKDGQIRTFYYEFRPEAIHSLGETLEVQNETLEVQNETLEVQNETLSIYINPPSLSPQVLDPLPDPWDEEKEKESANIVEEEYPDVSNLVEQSPPTDCQLDPGQDKSSSASSPIPKKRTINEKEVWEIAPNHPYPIFLNWWAATKYKPQGGHWAADALGNAYAEFYNNRDKTAVAIFPQFLEYMSRVTENCDELLNAEFKALLPSCFVLKPESTQENVQRLMDRVQSLVERGVQVALPTDTATPSCSQSMSFEVSEKVEILPFATPQEPKQLTGNAAIDNHWKCDRTLENEVAKYRSRWKYSPREREKIFEWVNNTPGVTLGVDGSGTRRGCIMTISIGTPVKITGGTHKGKKGTVSTNRPTNGHQKGKIPVVVGAKNDLYWVAPNWVCENFPPKQAEFVAVEQLPADTEIKILEFMRSRSHNSCISEIEIATVLDKSLFQIKKPLQNLLDNGFITSPLDNQYLLNKCNQLELLDSLRASVDSVEQPNSSVDLNGSNPSNSTTTPYKSCETTSITTSSTETFETITPPQEALTSTQSDFPVPAQATLAPVPDSTTQNQTFGSNLSVASVKEDPRLSLLKTLKDLSIEDFEQSLEDSEWQAISGTIRSSCQARKLEQRSAVPDFLQLPTLLALRGKNARPGGTTVCDKVARKLKTIRDSQLLSMEAMALISGFPQNWTKCLLGLKVTCRKEDSKQECSTDQQSSPNKPRSHSNESNISTPLSPGKQWLDPSLIILKDGTQSRDVDALYETDTPTVQRYAELMAEDLWEWEREPLPVPFLSSEGKIYASDCHHRVSAAILAKKKIFVDLRAGELIDAVIHSCTSNTSHGLPLRPKDQRKRIELFLDALSKLDETRSGQLLDSVPNITEIERKNGNWSARVIAKYLKLTESGYRTIINIFQERDMVEKFSHFKVGDWVHPTHWKEGEVAEICHFNKRNGVFVVVEGDTNSEWVHPGNLQLVEKPVTPIEKTTNSTDDPIQPTSVKQELKEKAANLGIPANGLPEAECNEGDPQSLGDRVSQFRSEIKQPQEDVCATVSALVSVADFLSNAEVEAIWNAIAPRVTKLGLLEIENAQT